MRTIHKYQLDFTQGTQAITMPECSLVLTAQIQDELNLVLWAKVNTNKEMTTRIFRVVMTGHSCETQFGKLTYISTVQNEGLVFHVFEVEDIEY